MKDFDIKKLKYDTDQVLGYFGLDKESECKHLKALIDVTIPSEYSLSDVLEKQRQRLVWEGESWNEEELKMHFLSVVFLTADFEVPKKIKLFYERPLSGVVKNVQLSVICDALLATPLGINTPQSPYFFLQVTQRASLVEKFKKGKKSQDDAEGQMLVAMLIAQAQNDNGLPVYGCYLQGQYWNFSTLVANRYCVSQSYDATRPNELIQIIHILQNLKNVILP